MNDPFEHFHDATAEDVMANPHKFGMPTFQEFKKSRGSWKKSKDNWFGAIEKGSELLGRMVKRHVYFLRGYEFKNLEGVETAAINMGLDPWKLIPRPQVINIGGGWCELHVTLEEPNRFGYLMGQRSGGKRAKNR